MGGSGYIVVKEKSRIIFFFLFQCERGSALHEAAMCGKSDVVQLLLDKGERGERDM